MYRVIIENKAKKEVRSLTPENIKRIVTAISSLKDNPRPRGVKKLIGKVGWRITVGDYRVLYDIKDKEKEVLVYRVKHRREVYRLR